MSRKLSKSHKNKISNAMKGRSLSEEQKAKIRISMKGINTWAKPLPGVTANYFTLKQYIQNLLASQKEELISKLLENLPKKKKEYKGKAMRIEILNWGSGFNNCLEEVIKIIKEL